MNELLTNETSTSGVEIASAVVEILREQGAATRPVLFSVVGQRLATRLGRSLREVLGPESLKRVVERSLGGMVRFEGFGPQLAARLDETAGSLKRPVRYDPTFWAAFSKPLGTGYRRFLTISRPFYFNDLPELKTPSDTQLEIPSALIPDAAVPKPARDAQIARTIDTWCNQHKLAPSDFLFQPHLSEKRRSDLPFESSRIPSGGTSALFKMIEAIPPEERSKYFLSLDLIYRLLITK
jgi:hypothetical protein